ncbi:response regulator [Corynebacterium flavescens]|uniref:response regulator n=1 Tax=Corynebacterium flavescens TaxID=28028 RepID=UPI003FCF8798
MESRTSPITVVVVDDQAMIRQGFAALLNAQEGITVVGDAADGAQAVQLVTRLLPDVVFMDVRMPIMDGLEAARRILHYGLDKAPRIIMLTTFDLDDYVYEALRIGCSGFLLKDAPAEALLAPTVTKRLIKDAVSRNSRTHSRTERAAARALSALTPREREVMEQIATGRSNAEIAAELFISEETVKSHVRKILQKLSLRDRAQVGVFAYEHGVV